MAGLSVRTRHATLGRLLEHADPAAPLAIRRGADGIVGRGVAKRMVFRGPDRFLAANAAWQRICAAATVDDEVRIPGTGLIAFGVFAFDDDSAAESVLIVPQVIVGRRGDHEWITTVDDAADHSTAIAEVRVVLHEGDMSALEYKRAVAAAQRAVATGSVEKTVLARDLKGKLPAGADLRSVLVGLGRRYPDAVSYAVDGMLGASPETLVAASHGSFFSRVLAGTAARGATPELDAEIAEALAENAKDLHEHRLAADSALTALQKFDPAASASAPYPLRLPNLWHLATDITGKLGGASTLEVLDVLHPTAAVAGTPTAAALELIRELENTDRGRYAGPVGWVDAEGGGEWVIALRGAQVTGEEIRAFAGAGVVAQSDPAAELAETAVKLRPITDAFADPLP